LAPPPHPNNPCNPKPTHPHTHQILNPAETFGDIIVDYSYVECTSACITALLAFRRNHPGHREAEIDAAIARALRFVRSLQRPDGSW
jgi:cycloartenol synthase